MTQQYGSKSAPQAAATAPARRRRGRPAGRTTADGVIADRNRLLAAAEDRIRQSGPAVSLESIAAAAGATKPTLYREVGDRDALVLALAERLAQRMQAAVSELVAVATGPREGLRNLVTGYLTLAAQDRQLYLFVTAGPGKDRVQQSLLLADGAAQQFAQPIAAHRTANGADPDVALVWSYGLLGALHFVTLWWLRDQSADMNVVADQITTLLWSGIQLESKP